MDTHQSVSYTHLDGYKRQGYDLLVMGRSEGEGCYCFVKVILREQVQKISGHYDYVITDNEAGMEHLSRKTTKHIDTLLLVSDCSRRSIQAVARIRAVSYTHLQSPKILFRIYFLIY